MADLERPPMYDANRYGSQAADPSALTTQLMLREIAALKAIFDERFDSVTGRLLAMDKAQELFETNLTRVPTEVDKQIQHVREIMDKMLATVHEKFASIDIQFHERDTRTEHMAQANEKALTAALAAAKEAFQEQNQSSGLAISKSEAATMKSIDQLTALFQTAIAAMGEQPGDLKGRVLLIEGRTVGMTAAQQTQQVQHTTQQASSSYLIAVIGLIIGALIGIGGLVITVLMRK